MKRLFIIAVGLILLALPVSASKGPIGPLPFRGDGEITLMNIHSEEIGRIRYREDSAYISKGFDELSNLLPCRYNHTETVFPADLLELIDHIQESFGDLPIQVISGYRSPELNAKLRREGHRVARKSLHMQGMAFDIRIPGVPTRKIRNYALTLKMGGVGFYRSKDFVHLDVGPVRSW